MAERLAVVLEVFTITGRGRVIVIEPDGPNQIIKTGDPLELRRTETVIVKTRIEGLDVPRRLNAEPRIALVLDRVPVHLELVGLEVWSRSEST